MSDAIEAALSIVHGANWLEHTSAAEAGVKRGNMTAALAAYEAAKSGGVGVKPRHYRDAPDDLKDKAKRIVADFGGRDTLLEGAVCAALVDERYASSALTSPASGERDAVIEVTDAMVEDGAVAIDALWSEGQDRGPAFAETEREYQAHCRSTARAAITAALRMEGK